MDLGLVVEKQFNGIIVRSPSESGFASENTAEMVAEAVLWRGKIASPIRCLDE